MNVRDPQSPEQRLLELGVGETTSIAPSATGPRSEHPVHANDPRFVDYYEKLSAQPRTAARFEAIQRVVLDVLGPDRARKSLNVADVGCNTGQQCHLWARRGHRVRGLDISEALLDTARKRARDAGLHIDFDLGSATNLPWPDASMDVCLSPELLEHVSDWEACLKEFARVLRPGGVLFLTTTNVLSPRQQEFNMPFYSWYPPPLKHYYERLAVTTRPDLANYATYPAVHWFSFYGLRKYLSGLGFHSLDCFDVMDPSEKHIAIRLALKLIKASSLLRFLAHTTRGGTMIVAVKQPSKRT